MLAGMALRWLRHTLGANKWSCAELLDKAVEVEPGGGRSRLSAVSHGEIAVMTRELKAPLFARYWRRPNKAVRSLLCGGFRPAPDRDGTVGRGVRRRGQPASGNGLASPLWRQIVADVPNRPLLQGHESTARTRWRWGCRERRQQPSELSRVIKRREEARSKV